MKSGDRENAIVDNNDDRKPAAVSSPQPGNRKRKYQIDIRNLKKIRGGVDGDLVENLEVTSPRAVARYQCGVTFGRSNDNECQKNHDQNELRTSSDFLVAKRLQEQYTKAELKISRANLKKEREEMMKSSFGKAFIAVEEILNLKEKAKAKLKENLEKFFKAHEVVKNFAEDTGILNFDSVSEDDMVFLAKNLLETQAMFLEKKIPAYVDIGFHFTNSINLDSIRTNGLMTKSERASQGIIPDRNNGSRYGDGVYTCDHPSFFSNFGDTGLIVARLVGTKKTFQLGSSLDGDENSIVVPKKKMIVLKTSSQCLPIFKYDKKLVASKTGIDLALILRNRLQNILNEVFNQGLTAPPSLWATTSTGKTKAPVTPPQYASTNGAKATNSGIGRNQVQPSNGSQIARAGGIGSAGPIATMKMNDIELQLQHHRQQVNKGIQYMQQVNANGRPTPKSAAYAAYMAQHQQQQRHLHQQRQKELQQLAAQQRVPAQQAAQARAKYSNQMQAQAPKPAANKAPKVTLSAEAKYAALAKNAALTKAIRSATKPPRGQIAPHLMQTAVVTGLPRSVVENAAQFARNRESIKHKNAKAAAATKIPVRPVPGGYNPAARVGYPPPAAMPDTLPPTTSTGKRTARKAPPVAMPGALPPAFGKQRNDTTQLSYTAPEKLCGSINEIDAFCRVPASFNFQNDCVICHDALANPQSCVTLKACSHVFHKACIEQACKFGSKCPTCRVSIGTPIGKSPSGSMTVCVITRLTCGGFPNCSTIAIAYSIRSGTQKHYHENPGHVHRGKRTVAYLPNNTDGQNLLKRLKFAFMHGLTFTVGTSMTTGAANQCTWSSIHHKTSPNGGVHGFPDVNYFTNCNRELDSANVPAAHELDADGKKLK